MSALSLSRRAILRGGVAAAALSAIPAAGAVLPDPLLAMDRERLRLKAERQRIEDWCEIMFERAPKRVLMECDQIGGHPYYASVDITPAQVVGRSNVSPERQAEYERRIPEMRAQDAKRKLWLRNAGVCAAEEKADKLHDQEWAIQDAIAGTPAISPAGIVVKLRRVLDSDIEDTEARYIHSAIADLERLGGAS